MGVRYELRGVTPPLVKPICFRFETRQPTRNDLPLLTGLYLESFRHTVDDKPLMGREIPNYFAGKYGPPHLDLSQVVFDGNELIAACLVSDVEEPGWEECPSITFLMVRPKYRRRGLASFLLSDALFHLSYHACTYITPGNTPSEAIFTKYGFQRIY